MCTLEGIVLIQSSGNYVKMLIIISRLSSKLGYAGLKARLQGPVIEKHSRGHSFDPQFVKLCQIS